MAFFIYCTFVRKSHAQRINACEGYDWRDNWLSPDNIIRLKNRKPIDRDLKLIFHSINKP
jgi:hypothetical protein